MARQSEFALYWRTIWNGIVTTIAGLGVTLKYLFSRPVTIEYPDVLPRIPEGHRGVHAFELDRCIRCRMCERICPVECITIELEGKGKNAEMLRYEIDYQKCLYCNLCCEVCPTECLWMTADWDLVCYRYQDCAVRFEHRDPDEERKKKWPGMDSHPDNVARKEKEKAEKKAKAKAEKEAKEKEDAESEEKSETTEKKKKADGGEDKPAEKNTDDSNEEPRE